MIGAIIGDVVGSIYERKNIKTTDFPLFDERSHFTDDTVLTVAIADSILNQFDFTNSLKKWGRKYPYAGYGYRFKKWMHSIETEPYNSWGNGSAMRVNPVGFAFDHLADVQRIAKQAAEVTHNHPEGIKGAQAVASAIFLARNGTSKTDISEYIEETFGYNLSRSIQGIRQNYTFDVSCQGSVPEAVIAFLESDDFESTIRLAISLGGDSDTIACIAGSIAHAFYGEPDIKIVKYVKGKLPLEMLDIIDEFESVYIKSSIHD